MTRDEEGSVLLLVIGFAIVLLAMVAVVVDVSAVVLAKRAAASAADGAASAAAQQLDRAALLTSGLDAGLPLDPEAVRRTVADYQRTSLSAQPGLILEVTVTGAVATVTATRVVRLPLGAPGSPSSTTVTAVATVRSPAVGP